VKDEIAIVATHSSGELNLLLGHQAE